METIKTINTFEALILNRTINPQLYGTPHDLGWEFYRNCQQTFRKGLIANAFKKAENIVITFLIANGVELSTHKLEEIKALAKNFVEEVNQTAKQDGYDRVAAVIGFERSASIARYISSECDIIPIVFDRISNSVYKEPQLVDRWINCFNRHPKIPQSYLDQFIADKSMLWVQQQLDTN